MIEYNYMTIWLILSGIVAPAIFWIGYFYYKDRLQPEPLVKVGLSYLMGFGAAFFCFQTFQLLPCIGIPSDPSALMVNGGRPFLYYCICVVGGLEELFKFLPFLVVLTFFKDFDEEIDGIIYASVIALGFASFENLDYLVLLAGFELFGRAVATPLTHSIFASIWGYKVGLAFYKKTSLVKAAAVGLSLSAVSHGLFDFLNLSAAYRIVSAILILFIWIWQIRLLEKMHHKQAKQRI